MPENDCGHVSYWSRMWGEVAFMFAEVARMEGMKAENQVRDQRGESVAYAEEAFDEVRSSLEACAARFWEI